VGEAKNMTLNVQNDGQARLVVSDIEWTLDVFEVSPVSAIIRSGDEATFTVTFAPHDDAEVHDTLRVHTNASDLPYIVVLSGDGNLRITTAEEGAPVPHEFGLEGNFPNPFSAETRIGYSIPDVSHVVLTVFDVMGREVARLVDETQPAGAYVVNVNPTEWPSGTYFYRLTAGARHRTGTMTRVR
jgi:hypothetical protein